MPCKNCTQHGSSSCLNGDRLHLRSWHPYALATAQVPQEPHAMHCEFLSEQHAALHAASCAWNFQGARLYSQPPYALATAPQEPYAMQCEFSSEQHAALHAASCAWNFQGAQLYSQMSEVFSSCANVWSEFNMSTLAMKKFLMRRAVVEPLC